MKFDKKAWTFYTEKNTHKSHFRHEEEAHWTGLKDLEEGKEVAKLRWPGTLIRSRHKDCE